MVNCSSLVTTYLLQDENSERYIRPDGAKRNGRINRLVRPASKEIVTDDNGSTKTIEQYFLDQYQFRLRYPELPCVHIGNPAKKIYIPMEFCSLQKQVKVVFGCHLLEKY